MSTVAPKESAPDNPKPSTSTAPPKPADGTKAMQDFFNAIEEEQTTMFNPQTGSPSPTVFQQQTGFNPFALGGAPGASPFQQPFGVQPQQTGFVMPQQTGFPHSAHNPFGQHLQPQFTAMPFMQPQPTAVPMMPQMTGINPFRQNTLNGMNGVQSQATGFNPSPFGPSPTNTSPFGPSPVNQGTSPFQNLGQTPGQQQQTPFNPASPFNTNQQSNMNSPFTLPQQMQQQQSQPPPQLQNPVNMFIPPRPASVPIKTDSPEPIKPLVAQQTGSKNPFGIPTSPPPPVPKVPTLMELAMNKQQELRQMQQQQQQQQNGQPGQISSPTSNPSAGSTMSSVASDFATLGFGNKPSANTLSPQMTSTTNSSFSTDTLFSSVSSQPTGATTSTVPSMSAQPTGLTSHTTGLGAFTGLKTFKPSSSFGASLLESLPPIPGSGPTTPSVASENQGQLGEGQPGSPQNPTISPSGPTTTTSITLGGLGGLNSSFGNQSQPNGSGPTLGGSGLNTQPTRLGALNSQQPLTTGLGGGLGTGSTGFGSNLNATTGTGAGGAGFGLGPQMTGMQGVANPFRTTGFSSSASTPGLGTGGGFGGFGTSPSFGLGGGFTGGLGGLGGTPFGQNPTTQPQPQQQQQSSLI